MRISSVEESKCHTTETRYTPTLTITAILRIKERESNIEAAQIPSLKIL